MAPRGRPSDYTPELALDICERLSNGVPLARICEQPGMPSFTTVWRWEHENEEFRKLSAHARLLGTHHLADECIALADKEDLDPAHKRIMIDTRIRLIGKWNAKNYGDKLGLGQAEDLGPLTVVINKPE